MLAELPAVHAATCRRVLAVLEAARAAGREPDQVGGADIDVFRRVAGQLLAAGTRHGTGHIRGHR